MNKINAKTLRIIGLAIEIGHAFLLLIIGFMFPNISEPFITPFLSMSQFTVVVIFTLELAQRRRERGEIKTSSLLRALTPAQICLTASSFLFFAAYSLLELLKDTSLEPFVELIAVLGMLGLGASIVLAGNRALKKRKARKAAEYAQKSLNASAPESKKALSMRYCDMCGAATYKDALVGINGQSLCSSCAEIITAEQAKEPLNTNEQCSVCGNECEKSKMIFVNDRYICNSCFLERYAGLTSLSDNEEGNSDASSYIKALSKVYITFIPATGDTIPSVDESGCAWLFSKKEYADSIIQNYGGENMFYREFGREELIEFVKTWYLLGIQKLKLNSGINDRSAEIERDEFLPINGVGKYDVAGSYLNHLIIRFRQNSSVENNRVAHAFAMTMLSTIYRELYRCVFLVPFLYDDDPDSVKDPIIHVTTAGAERLAQKEKKRQADNGARNESEIAASDGGSNPFDMLNKELIYASEKYRFAKEDEATPGKTMHLRTVINNGSAFLCAFTDFESLRKIYGEEVRVSLATYEEIIASINDSTDEGSALHGLVINPGSNELVLLREDIEQAEKEKEHIKFYGVDN